MYTKYILLGLAGLFLMAAVMRMSREGWRVTPASRTWLLIAVIFTAVGTWLFMAP